MNTNHVELFIHQPTTETSAAWLQIVLKLLDWPFLIFVASIFFIWFFRRQLKVLLRRRNIEIKWGDKSILLQDLAKKIEQDIDSKFDSIQDAQEIEIPRKIDSDLLAKKPQGVQFANDASVQHADDLTTDPLNRMKEELMSPTFRWRTLSRLSRVAGISESEARSLLPSLKVDFDVNKSGQTLVKLKSR
jgi:hypothetical protein